MLLARQRAEEPGTEVTFHEVGADDLMAGLRDGRYDVGLSLQESNDPHLESRPLWAEPLAVAVSERSPLLEREELTIEDVLSHPLFRWPAEVCPQLDQRLGASPSSTHRTVRVVNSFELMALRVAAGYGVGVSARSRIERGWGWGVRLRPLVGGPYEVVAYLMRSIGHQKSRREWAG